MNDKTIQEKQNKYIESNIYKTKCFSFEDQIITNDNHRCCHQKYHQHLNELSDINKNEKDENAINNQNNNENNICIFVKKYKDDFWEEEEKDNSKKKFQNLKDYNNNINNNYRNDMKINNDSNKHSYYNIDINDLIIENQQKKCENNNNLKYKNSPPLNNKKKKINKLKQKNPKKTINDTPMNHCNITPSNSKILSSRYNNSMKKNKTIQSSKRKYTFQYYSKDDNEGNQFFEETILNIKNKYGKSDPVKLYHFHDRDWSKNRFLSELRKKEILLFK